MDKKTTIIAPVTVSFPVGQVTLNISCYTSWQERRESNPQPPVLETGALPIELHS